jgi:hypothetical protein
MTPEQKLINAIREYLKVKGESLSPIRYYDLKLVIYYLMKMNE